MEKPRLKFAGSEVKKKRKSKELSPCKYTYSQEKGIIPSFDCQHKTHRGILILPGNFKRVYEGLHATGVEIISSLPLLQKMKEVDGKRIRDM